MSISEILNNYPDHGKQNSYYFYFYLAWLGINTWKRKMCWLLFTIHVRIFSILQENYTSIKSTFCLIMMWWRPFPMKPMLKYTKLSSVTVSYEYMKLFKDWWQFLFGSFEITSIRLYTPCNTLFTNTVSSHVPSGIGTNYQMNC